MPANLDIYLQRNEDWGRTLALTAGGSPIDLTGCVVALQVRDKLRQFLITDAEVEIFDAVNGYVNVILRASEGSALSNYGAPIQTANLHYDCRVTDSDGFETILFGGLIVLSRGETRA